MFKCLVSSVKLSSESYTICALLVKVRTVVAFCEVRYLYSKAHNIQTAQAKLCILFHTYPMPSEIQAALYRCHQASYGVPMSQRINIVWLGFCLYFVCRPHFCFCFVFFFLTKMTSEVWEIGLQARTRAGADCSAQSPTHNVPRNLLCPFQLQ